MRDTDTLSLLENAKSRVGHMTMYNVVLASMPSEKLFDFFNELAKPRRSVRNRIDTRTVRNKFLIISAVTQGFTIQCCMVQIIEYNTTFIYAQRHVMNELRNTGRTT